jgi:hypothetical protein
MDLKNGIARRDVLATAATAFTTSLFTGNVRGATIASRWASSGWEPWAPEISATP